jgi:glycosyltransferase involved in cell wall biosynthesis
MHLAVTTSSNDVACGGAAKSISVGLLTGGGDKHYAMPLAASLASKGVQVDFIGSDQLDCEEVRRIPGLRFLNLRGDQREDAGKSQKAIRILRYYARLLRYAAGSDCRVLHILWNNKFELFDRTLLMLYYRVLGKRIAFTAHNVNAAVRDSKDNWLNRLSLRIQYALCSRVFVHTDLMKRQLIEGFDLAANKVTVIPYGINDAVPIIGLTQESARTRLELRPNDRVLLFFGQIAPYKGLEFLIDATATLTRRDPRIRLLIAGKVKRGWEQYWAETRLAIAKHEIGEQVVEHIRFIPDEEIELYFAAADVLVLPYTDIFQSGILFLGFGFGIPVIASDVGSLRHDVIDGKTGFVCAPRDSAALATAVGRYFDSDLYRNREQRRQEIRRLAHDAHSWSKVAEIVTGSYAEIAGAPAAPRTTGPR